MIKCMDVQEFGEYFNSKFEIVNQIDKGFTNETYIGIFRDEDVFVKFSSDGENSEDLKCSYEASNILSSLYPEMCPAPVRFKEIDNAAMLIFELERANVPNIEEWKNARFCKNIIDTASKLVNILHDDDIFDDRLGSAVYCNRDVDRYTSYEKFVKKSENHDELAEYSNSFWTAYQYLNSNRQFERKFNHNDIALGNSGLRSGLFPMFDWENCGFSDPLLDVASVEASIIDDVLSGVHSSRFVEEMRDRYRKSVSVDTSKKRYKYHRLLLNLKFAIFVANGDCSEYWSKVGNSDECFDLKMSYIDSITRNLEK